MSDTATLERPVETKTNEPPELFHYVNKNEMTRAAVFGGLVRALCGHTFPVTKVFRPGLPVCAPCQEIFDQMRTE